MKFFDYFQSRHSRYLEAQITELRAAHAAEIKTLRDSAKSELDYARSELGRQQNEIDRLRLYLTPALAPQETEAAPAAGKESVSGGTPWMRILQREIAAQDAEANARYTKPVEEESTRTN